MKKLVFLLVLALAPLSAQVVTYQFEGVFYHSDVSGYVNVGDTYQLSFKLNLDAEDNLGDLDGGSFTGAISDLTFSLGSGSTGSYAGGTMTGSQFLQLSDGGFADSIHFYASHRFSIDGLDFPDAGSAVFSEVSFDLGSTNLTTYNPVSGLGDRLGDVLSLPLELSNFDNSDRVALVFNEFTIGAFASIDSISVSAVPEPTTTSAWFAGAVLLVVGIRRRRAQASTRT